MIPERLASIPGFSIDRVARAAGHDPDVLRLENLDTDLPPPPAAVEATRAAVGRDNDNSYLPFTGQLALCDAVARHLTRTSGVKYALEQVIITAGGTEGMLDALLATVDPGDEVVITDPTYAGMIYRVRLTGAVPRFIRWTPSGTDWRLDLDSLTEAVSSRTRAMFIMNPSMPTGAVLTRDEWQALRAMCVDRDAWLIYNAAMERILFDGREHIHPASLPDMADRTLTVGSVSKEYRMIGWRIGWVAGPQRIMGDVAKAHIYNVVTPPGVTQSGAAVALDGDGGVEEAVREWQARRDAVTRALSDYDTIPAAGGWSQLLNVGALDLDSSSAWKLLLERGQVAATPMRDWGVANSDQFVRLVFSNEPVERLETLGSRVERAFA